MMENYTGGLDLLTDIFIRDVGPYHAPFFKHILSYWNQKQSGNPNILVIFYEDMQRDIRSVIKKIATFLKVDVTDDSVELLVEHTSFKNMKVNPMTNMSHAVKVSAFLYFETTKNLDMLATGPRDGSILSCYFHIFV